MRAPSPTPVRQPFSSSAAHCTSPPSTGASKPNTRLVTPPVEVITTTMTTCGCSSSTSMWRIVAVLIGGAETIARRLVTCESVSVVTRIASSTSRRISWSSRPGRASTAVLISRST